MAQSSELRRGIRLDRAAEEGGMKIVDRKIFLQLPAGTVFSKYQPQIFSGLMIKGESFFYGVGDFLYQDLIGNVLAESSTVLFDTLMDKGKTAESFPLDFDVEERDGLFDENQFFAIYEPADIAALIAKLQSVSNGDIICP
jgi:hypothetical protein